MHIFAPVKCCQECCSRASLNSPGLTADKPVRATDLDFYPLRRRRRIHSTLLSTVVCRMLFSTVFSVFFRVRLGHPGFSRAVPNAAGVSTIVPACINCLDHVEFAPHLRLIAQRHRAVVSAVRIFVAGYKRRFAWYLGHRGRPLEL